MAASQPVAVKVDQRRRRRRDEEDDDICKETKQSTGGQWLELLRPTLERFVSQMGASSLIASCCYKLASILTGLVSSILAQSGKHSAACIADGKQQQQQPSMDR